MNTQEMGVCRIPYLTGEHAINCVLLILIPKNNFTWDKLSFRLYLLLRWLKRPLNKAILSRIERL